LQKSRWVRDSTPRIACLQNGWLAFPLFSSKQCAVAGFLMHARLRLTCTLAYRPPAGRATAPLRTPTLTIRALCGASWRAQVRRCCLKRCSVHLLQQLQQLRQLSASGQLLCACTVNRHLHTQQSVLRCVTLRICLLCRRCGLHQALYPAGGGPRWQRRRALGHQGQGASPTETNQTCLGGWHPHFRMLLVAGGARGSWS